MTRHLNADEHACCLIVIKFHEKNIHIFHCLGEGSNSSSSVQDEPSSSQALDQQGISLASLQATLREREREIVTQRMESERFLKELQDSVECPVCFSIPRAPPVPCCSNGHVICNKCKDKVDVCPTCRVTMTNCVSQVHCIDKLPNINHGALPGGSHNNPTNTTPLRLARCWLS